MGVSDYRQKRDFTRSPEPSGSRKTGPRKPARKRSKPLIFVVQKHRASHLHYDFRLEWDGVLLSWAVPKGPSLEPKVKRLARRVEDHPLDYAQFEGVIPSGGYGGGTVMVWDFGSYAPSEPDVGAALREGELKFTLEGKKLRGGWVLIHTGGMRVGQDGRNWLLIKHRDAAASEEDITIVAPCSVLSGRSLAQIARDEGGDVSHAASGDPDTASRCRRSSPSRNRTARSTGARGRTARGASARTP